VTLKRLLEHRRLRRENRRLRAAAGADYGFEGLIGASAPWLAARRLAEAAAATEAAILLTGESGTGKELAARAIHAASPRAAGPFVALNCAAVPRDLLESELFGHEPGAFTGAVKRRIGRLELADNGTLLLDEIGDMAVELQAKLLRVLEEKSVLRLGGVKPVRADFRVVAATNRDLRALIGEGRFREDLFYRLNVLAVRLPPLRERPGDIALLLDHFLRRGAASRGAPPPIVTAPIMRMIEEHGWPGNVRELISFTERILLLTDGEEVTEGIVEAALGGETRPAPRRPTAGTATATLPDAVRDLEERLVREALEAEAGNRTNAARRLGISLRALQYRLKAFEIES
jgi:transcriptional regulator with PAS, ATPase and Fis domain